MCGRGREGDPTLAAECAGLLNLMFKRFYLLIFLRNFNKSSKVIYA